MTAYQYLVYSFYTKRFHFHYCHLPTFREAVSRNTYSTDKNTLVRAERELTDALREKNKTTAGIVGGGGELSALTSPVKPCLENQ